MKTNIQHIIQLRKQNRLKYWVTYLRIKKFINGRGYISRKDTRKCCGSKYSTFINHINKMIQFGWMRKSPRGYFLVSYHIIAGLKRIEILGESENELIARASALSWDKNIIQQIYKIAGNNIVKRKQHLSLKKGGRIDCSEYSVGVRWFANLMGYKSPSSGSKVEKLMVEFGLLKITKQEKILFHFKDHLGWFWLKKAGIINHCFIKNDYVYQRLLNRLVPVN